MFVGERRSKAAKRMGVTWRDGRLAGKQLFDALHAIGLNPAQHQFCNVFERGGCRSVKRAVQTGRTIVAMGKKVQAKLLSMGITFRSMVHPAARGAIRKKHRYIRHVRTKLMPK